VATVKTRIALERAFWSDVYAAYQDPEASETLAEQKEAPPAVPPPKASFKLLTANVKRLTAAFEPYTYYYNRILVLQRWDNPHETALMLTLYVLCCYYQKLLPGFCGWVLALLVRGYLREVGYLKRPKTEESPDEDLSLRERAKRAFTVSRKVQNVLGGVADFLERIQNLLTWKVPAHTLKVVYIMAAGLILTLLLPIGFLRTCAEVFIGYRFFVLGAIYSRYPHIHDTYADRIISSLPTNANIVAANREAEKQIKVEAQVQAEHVPTSPHKGRTLTPSRSPRSVAKMVADGVRRRAGSGSSIRDLSESPERDDVQSAKLHAQKTEILARLKMDDSEVLQLWPCVHFVDGKMTKPRQGRLALLREHIAFVRNDADECLIVPLDQLERIARTTRTILKVPVLELLLKAEVSEQRMVYQFGTVANSSDVVAAVEKQIGNLRKDE